MENKNNMICVIIVTYSLIAFGIVIRIIDIYGLPPIDLLIVESLTYFVMTIVGATLFFFAYQLLKRAWTYIDKDAFETRIHLLMQQLSRRLRQRNSEAISPCLQNFLYGVLRRNEDTLNLQLGDDVLCLSPNGVGVADRNGCLFYQFQLILPLEFDGDDRALRGLIQSFIISELLNYGIAGLNSTYSGKAGISRSVYLDRLTLNERSHLLTFEILYVSSRVAEAYLQKAVQRDRQTPSREPEVYDDEI